MHTKTSYRPRIPARAALLLAAACAVLGVSTAGADGGQGSCPNATVRSQQGTERLPECRALEQVSSVRKGSGDLFIEYKGQPPAYNVFSSLDGNVVNYVSHSAVPASPSAPLMKSISARRTAEGWANVGNDPAALGRNGGANVMAVSDDGSRTLIGGPIPSVPGGGPSTNIYVGDVASGVYTAVTREVPGGGPNGGGGPEVMGGTADFGHVIFSDQTPHTAEAVPTVGYPQVYDYSAGAVRLASVMPDGSPAPFGASGSTYGISRDGTKVFFTTGHDSQIYMRVNGTETRAVSASQKTAPDPSPTGGRFWALSADGRTAVFVSADQLVDGDTDTTADLYGYDTETGKLTRLTDGIAFDGVVGVADDASIIYLSSGFEILALDHGTVSSVGRGADVGQLALGGGQTARVSTDGSRVVFLSDERLTGYDNGGVQEVYVYDAGTGQTMCASCRADGRRPTGAASLPLAADRFRPAASAASVVATARSISDDGRRVFFSTFDRLVPEDVNSASDAYEFLDGKVYLLSGGRGSENSLFMQASADGSDVFFSTRERLTGTDKDELVDIYDARISGGYVEPPASSECVQDSCQGAPTHAAVAAVGATAILSSAGDPTLATRIRARKVSVARPKVASGTSTVLKVNVPSAGVVSVSGASVAKATREASKAKTLSLRVRLTEKARAALKRKRRLAVVLSVRFAPAAGQASAKQLTVVFRRASAGRSASGKSGR